MCAAHSHAQGRQLAPAPQATLLSNRSAALCKSGVPPTAPPPGWRAMFACLWVRRAAPDVPCGAPPEGEHQRAMDDAQLAVDADSGFAKGWLRKGQALEALGPSERAPVSAAPALIAIGQCLVTRSRC